MQVESCLLEAASLYEKKKAMFLQAECILRLARHIAFNKGRAPQTQKSKAQWGRRSEVFSLLSRYVIETCELAD